MPTEEWIPPDLFSTILEGYTNENHEEAVQKALDKLFKPTDLETLNFEKDAENIDKAIELNEQMQNKVEHMINAIDQRLEQNVEFMVTDNSSSSSKKKTILIPCLERGDTSFPCGE